MANEIQIRTQVTIRKGNLDYRSNPARTVEDMDGDGGPTPGAVLVPTAGVDIDLSQLTTPGRCWIQNQDDTNYVEIGIHDGSVFHPLMEILPGNVDSIRFSRNIGQEHDVPGTGTTGDVNTVHIRANGDACWVTIDAFEA